jgi:hypothetical protein
MHSKTETCGGIKGGEKHAFIVEEVARALLYYVHIKRRAKT